MLSGCTVLLPDAIRGNSYSCLCFFVRDDLHVTAADEGHGIASVLNRFIIRRHDYELR
jgi:hypothetical protein